MSSMSTLTISLLAWLTSVGLLVTHTSCMAHSAMVLLLPCSSQHQYIPPPPATGRPWRSIRLPSSTLLLRQFGCCTGWALNTLKVTISVPSACWVVLGSRSTPRLGIGTMIMLEGKSVPLWTPFGVKFVLPLVPNEFIPF